MISVNSLKKTMQALLIVPVLLMLQNAIAYTPEKFIECKEVYILQHVDASRVKYKKVQFAVHGNTLIYAQYLNNAKDDTLRFYKKDLSSGKEENVKVFIKNFHELYDPRSIYNSIDFDLQYVCILLGKALVLLKDGGDGYHLHSLTNLESSGYSFNKLKLRNNNVILHVNYNDPQNDHKTCIAVFDIVGGKIINSIQPDFNLIALTHIGPHDYIHVSTDDHIIFSQAQQPDFKIYDSLLHQTDSFSFDIDHWNKLDGKSFDSVLETAGGITQDWFSYVSEHSRVFYSYLLNSQTVLMGYDLTKDSLEYALLKKSKDEWTITNKKGFSIKDWSSRKEGIDKDDWFLYKMSWSQNLFFDNNDVYMMQLMSDKFPWEMSSSDLKKYEEKYYEDNDPLVYILKAEVK